jgi:hypothetical protein
MPSGELCQSPALKGERFCHFHRLPETRRRPRRIVRNLRRCELEAIPKIEDPGLVQQLMLAIARNGIDRKQAGLVLFALQIPCDEDAAEATDVPRT